jgi:3'(2'), 5'-bisphosphate nucleotidase
LKKIYWNDEKNEYRASTNSEFELIKSSIEVIHSRTSINPYKIVGSRSHSGIDTEVLIAKSQNIYNNVEFISMASSLKLCLIAEGVANIYPR